MRGMLALTTRGSNLWARRNLALLLRSAGPWPRFSTELCAIAGNAPEAIRECAELDDGMGVSLRLWRGCGCSTVTVGIHSALAS